MNKEKLSCEFRSFVYFPLIAAEYQNIVSSRRVRDFIEHVFSPFLTLSQFWLSFALIFTKFSPFRILKIDTKVISFFPYCFRLAVLPPSILGILHRNFEREREITFHNVHGKV